MGKRSFPSSMPVSYTHLSYKEVKKDKTFSMSRDGIVYIQVQLNDELNNKDEFWSKFKHGVSTFKAQLPKNVLAVQVMDDFGDTSALLITMESVDKTYRELDDYMDALQDLSLIHISWEEEYPKGEVVGEIIKYLFSMSQRYFVFPATPP